MMQLVPRIFIAIFAGCVMPKIPHHYDHGALLERLTKGIKKRPQEVIFLVGAPMSSGAGAKRVGVPDVEGVIELIRQEFLDDDAQLQAFEASLARTASTRYQSAFAFLVGRRGQPTANEIVRRAVCAARSVCVSESADLGEDLCRSLDSDVAGWYLSPGTENLGKLISSYPQRFGRHVLTTNFDPLIQIAIQRAGGHYFRTTLAADGNLTQTEGSGCHVIHLHGYWYGSDTLHTTRQLTQPRPLLRASLGALLRNTLVVVCAYGGWDDAFTEALIDVVRDDSAFPEVLWTFNSADPTIDEHLSARLSPGIDRGRVNFYAGIDCHQFFPQLFEQWARLENPFRAEQSRQLNVVQVPQSVLDGFDQNTPRPIILEGDDEDRPPVVEFCVGRENELETLNQSKSKCIFVTGIGGQGKSTLAAKYFNDAYGSNMFSHYVWRDCKEESERFENQLAAVVEKLSDGQIFATELAKQSAEVVVAVLLEQIRGKNVLFVFDNVDHYVDLEKRTMIGSVDIFIRSLIRSVSNSRAIFTCRPSVRYEDDSALTCALEGIDFNAARSLFQKRGAASSDSQIREAHELTNGHAFWLDLLGIQVAKRAADLKTVLNQIQSGGGLLPDKTLNSIWKTLKDREQIVLRGMAETVKAATEAEIGDYLAPELNFNKFQKALKALRVLNLVVVKKRPNLGDVLELHPLVRQFVRRTFTIQERATFIDGIIQVYKKFISSHRDQLLEEPQLTVLQHWTENAELDIAAGAFEDAFLTLAEVAQAFLGSPYPREFTRVARLLFEASDWVTQWEKYKGFERVVRTHIKIVSHLGSFKEVGEILSKYEMTVPNKDSRYINFCDLKSYSLWVLGDYSEAVRWGKIGKELKISSGVDTDSEIEHSLALAERDSGYPEAALPLFLEGRARSEVTDPKEFDQKRSGPHYGNVGRCLHLMGQVDEALVCYQKSAILVETRLSTERILNQGYIRFWIAELLLARQQPELASSFYREAYRKWQAVAPPKAKRLKSTAKQIGISMDSKSANDDATCLDWIFGRNAKFAHSLAASNPKK
jgi:tetratricopeptide (TPR) repeat protein